MSNKTNSKQQKQSPEDAVGIGPEIQKRWKTHRRRAVVGGIAVAAGIIGTTGLVEGDLNRSIDRIEAEKADASKNVSGVAEREPSQLELDKQTIVSEFREQLETGMQPIGQVVILKPGVNVRNYPFEFGKAGGTPLRHEIQTNETATLYYPFEVSYGGNDLLMVFDPRSEEDVFSPENFGFISKDAIQDAAYAEIQDSKLPDGSVVAEDGVLKLTSDSGNIEVGRLAITR